MIDRRLGLLACAFVLLVAGPGLRAHGAESVTWNDDEIDAGLDELEKLAAAGRTDAAKLAHIKTSIMRSMINGPDGGTMRLLWQQIGFDELVGKQVLGGSFITDHVTKTLENGGGMVALGGGVAAIDKFGTAYSYHGSGTMLRSEDVIRRPASSTTSRGSSFGHRRSSTSSSTASGSRGSPMEKPSSTPFPVCPWPH